MESICSLFVFIALPTMKRIAIIGGGAAGFMAAIIAKEQAPNANVYFIRKQKRIK